MQKLPARLSLPSGTTVRIARPEGAASKPRSPNAPLFDEAIEALRAADILDTNGAPIEPTSLALRDFHVLRAVFMRSGFIHEEEVTIHCRNCDAEIRVVPCTKLEIAPWVDGEAHDPELDHTLPLGEPIEIPAVPLGRVRVATTVTFEERTVVAAASLFEKVAEQDLIVDTALTRAMGIVALGVERNALRIAEALSACEDDRFAAVADAFLGSHYVPRLVCVVYCGSCNARNDVDAPYEREFDLDAMSRSQLDASRSDRSPPERRARFPSYDAFAERAVQIAKVHLANIPGEPVEVLVDEGTPAVDDGGEPLLGSYVPPHPGDATNPSRPPSVTVYYRTFLAVWNEEGPYDWEDEIEETIEHELEHHVYFLRGDDPMDDEERAEIRAETVRLVGRREAGRRELTEFGASLKDFGARTWPLWVIAFVALLAMLATQR